MASPSTLVRGAEFMTGAVGSLMKHYRSCCGIALSKPGHV